MKTGSGTGFDIAENQIAFAAAAAEKPVFSCFRSAPWIENRGMEYKSDPSREYRNSFYSYSHTFADILNAIIGNGLLIRRLREYDRDISDAHAELNGRGLPLSYILIAGK